jgi:hypothetical protein
MDSRRDNLELPELPVDERAVLTFLCAQAGDRDEFISTIANLLPKLRDCSPERFCCLARRLERRGLIERRKINHVGTEWLLLVKLPTDATTGDRFAVPQNKPRWSKVASTME